MDSIIILIFGIAFLSLIMFLWFDREYIIDTLTYVQNKKPWLSSALVIGLGVLCFLFYYFIFPYFFVGTEVSIPYPTDGGWTRVQIKDIEFGFIVVYTFTNYSALFLSWYYFDNTHCIDDELNGIGRKAYKLMGEDLTHVVMLIIRTLINVLVIDIVVTDKVSVTIPEPNKFEIGLAFYSFITALFTCELISNISSNFYFNVEPCETNRHYLCERYGRFCDEPTLIKKKRKNTFGS